MGCDRDVMLEPSIGRRLAIEGSCDGAEQAAQADWSPSRDRDAWGWLHLSLDLFDPAQS